MNIKKKLLAIMILISFIPLIVFSGVAVQYLGKTLETEIIGECREQAIGVKLQINRYLDKPFASLKSIAANQAVKNLDLPQVKKFLVEVQKVNPENTFVLDDLKGNQVVRGDDIPVVNIWERPFYQAALKGQDEVISGVVFSKNSNRFVVNLMTPVRDSDAKRVVGVMQGSITLTKISEFATNLSKNGMVAYVIDSEGKILAHPTAELVKDRTDMNEVSYVKKGLTEKQSGFTILEDKTGKKLVTYEYDERTGWLICLEAPYSVVTEKTHSLLMLAAAVTLGILLIVLILAFFIAKSFSQPILSMQQMASKIAQGDLSQTVEIKSRDEIGLLAEAFGTMVANLKKLVGKVQENSRRLSSASEELTLSAEQSSTASDQVAASINEVAKAADKQYNVVSEVTKVIRQMSESIQQAAKNAAEVSEESSKAVATAEDGDQSVQGAVKKMQDIEGTVSASASAVAQLGERSQEIGQIVDTISSIAGQTNLLALNAAIEAARAGEQGRGFAVVAEEVRKLAEQSEDAAQQIAVLIREIQGETEKAVFAMQEGTKEVKSGTGVIHEAGRNFRHLRETITGLSVQVKDISAAMQHVAENSEQAVLSVQEIKRLTAETADEMRNASAATEEQSATIAEIAVSSHKLGAMAQDLQEAASKFKI